jgi:hypothetical protein
MIVFELTCPDHHRFEGWFASGDDFESQKARGLLSCPICSDTSIEKLLTAKIGKTEAEPPRKHTPPTPAKAIQPRNINELIDVILLNTENVGEEFPAEARRIHYREAPRRSIRGVATREQTEDLLDEGIAVMPLPVPPRGDWH